MIHKTDSFDDKIKVIDKYYKDDELFLKVYFENYNTFHIYIRVDYENRIIKIDQTEDDSVYYWKNWTIFD